MENDQIEIIESDFSMIEDSETIAKLNDIIENIELLKIEYLKTKGENVTLKDLSQSEYIAFLMYCNFNYFRPTKCLFKYSQGINNNNHIVCMYDDVLLYCLCEYYIYMSNDANKICNPYGFSSLIGCDLDIFSRWEKLKEQRPQVYGLTKSLRKAYESALEVGAQTGKNPVGFIATLNHRFGWSSEGKTTLTVNITRNKDEIMSSVNPELIGKNE